jgi:hypothetical protein
MDYWRNLSREVRILGIGRGRCFRMERGKRFRRQGMIEGGLNDGLIGRLRLYGRMLLG